MNLSNDKIKEIKEKLESASTEEKTDAIVQAIEDIYEEKYAKETKKIEEMALKAEADADYKERLGLRKLDQETKDFYEKFKEPKQAITSGILTTIPTNIISLVQTNLERLGKVMSHVNIAPAGVSEWFTAQTTGSFAWKEIDAAFDKSKDLKSTFSKITADIGKLYVLIIIPKSIAKLSYEFIDKYFIDMLTIQADAGENYAFFEGDGVNMPIGIYKQIDKVESDGKHLDKEVHTDVLGFSPKQLAPMKNVLSKNGDRDINGIVLFCNTADRANYVDPAMLDDIGNNISSDKSIVVVDSPQNPKGKAAFYLDKSYTMAMDSMEFNNYDQTLALEDANLLIADCHANGRAIDDDCAYVFDVTKLKEYIRRVEVIAASTQSVANEKEPQIEEA
ncbi:MAG: phage major capsid protein [Bacilli bacterium]|nr:phage major capsid protein [Bacilli bacterium]